MATIPFPCPKLVSSATAINKSNAVLSALDNLFLHLLGELNKESAIAGHTHHQTSILLRMKLCFPQHIRCQHVKLDVVALHVHICLDHVKKFPLPILGGQGGWVELHGLLRCRTESQNIHSVTWSANRTVRRGV